MFQINQILNYSKQPNPKQMGIKFLNKYLRTNCPTSIKEISIAELSGKKIAIDISIYLYKYESEDSLLENMYLLLSILRYYNIIPIFIFDGKSPAEKKPVIQQRINNRADAEIEYKCLKEKIKHIDNEEDKQEIIETLNQLKKKIVYITKPKVDLVKSLIRSYGVTYYDAHGEADELCAILVIRKIVWACLSEDMDMFVYGCNRVIRYFSLMNHTAVLYCTKGILEELQLTQPELRQICILSGTDYNVNYDSQSIDLFDIMRYFNKYKQKGPEGFYNWLTSNVKGIDLDIPLLDKINNMFDVSSNKTLEDYTNISVINTSINHNLLESILKKDGFIFL